MKNKAGTAADIGAAIRKKRKEDGLTLAAGAEVLLKGINFRNLWRRQTAPHETNCLGFINFWRYFYNMKSFFIKIPPGVCHFF